MQTTTPYLIIAISARALVESASDVGYLVHSFDLFADVDTRNKAQSAQKLNTVDMRFDEDELFYKTACYVKQYPDLKLILGAGYECHVNLVDRLEAIAPVIANKSTTLCFLHNKDRLSALFKDHAIYHPALIKPENVTAPCLVKSQLTGGGTGVHWYTSQYISINEHQYIQEYLPGKTLSAVFFANGRMGQIVGFNVQLHTSQFADTPFLYLGAIGHSPSMFTLLNDEQRQEIQRIVNILTKASGLYGLAGLDFILTDNGDIAVLEINPRPTATFELHAGDDQFFHHHLACFDGQAINIKPNQNMNFRGHAILYAKQQVYIDRFLNWPAWVKDRPCADSVILKRWPICSVYAAAPTISDVQQQLRSRLLRIESMIIDRQNAA